MAWSTREIADLAGTTVNAVRHYHRTGLLAEPGRMSNGYKQYQVAHLVRLLQIRRLRDLGVPLDQIEQVGVGGATTSQALLAIDADLGVSIERLQRARAEIKAVLQGAAATDVPSGFEDLAPRMSATERSLVLIYSQLYDEEAMADVRRMLEAEPDEPSAAFDALAPDADEETRRHLAERYASTLAKNIREYPWVNDPAAHLSKSPQVTKNTFLESIIELYNPAQLDVIGRASVIAQQLVAASKTAPDEGEPPPPPSPGSSTKSEGDNHDR